MGIPRKALRHSQLKYLTAGSAVADGSHQTFRVTVEEDGVTKNAFFKLLAPKNHYPELLAKISVATSSFKRLFQGKRSAEERLVFDDEDKLIGTLSFAMDNFKSFHFASEKIPPEESSLKEQVAPSTKTLIEKNIMELLVGRWFLDDDDAHPHNMSLVGDIDFDMFFYWFTIYMKEPRSVIGVPKNHVFLSVRDYEAFPNVQESKPFHWPPFTHPGKTTIPKWVPGQETILGALPVFSKAYADPVQFARLAQDSDAQEQKLAAALKALLTFQPELQRRRLTELFGDLPLNYTSLDETDPALRAKYEELFPLFCNKKTNVKSFVDFMMDLYQEHYDNLYRVVVFYMGCSDNGFGIPLPATCLALYQKPSFYLKTVEWVLRENELQEEGLRYSLPELKKRYHQVWRDAFAPSFKELLNRSYRLINTLLKEATSPPHTQLSEAISKQVTDYSLTSAWELFGTMPELSADVLDSKISVDKNSKLRDALLSLVAFTNKFHELTRIYYSKERHDLTEEDNRTFAHDLISLHRDYNVKIREYLANTTTYAGEFNAIAKSLSIVTEQVNFGLHLTTTDELMYESLLSIKKEILPITHKDVKKQYHDSLFVWAKGLRPEELERYVFDIIDKKYTPLFTFFSSRQRSEPVKKYLRASKQESGDNRLAYILCSGSADGALNTLLIEELTPLMLQKYPIPSIDLALREGTFKNELTEITKDAVDFARTDKRFTHSYSEVGMSLFYKTIYDWADTVERHSFNKLIQDILNQYEGKVYSSHWNGTRRSEVEGYSTRNSNSKQLALIFKNGQLNSKLNECLFDRIINTMKNEITKNKFPSTLEDRKNIIEQFNEEHKNFYLGNIKRHFQTNDAAKRHSQPPLLQMDSTLAV